MVNINCPSRCPISKVYDALVDGVTSICTAAIDRLVLCDDINCLGVDGIYLSDGLVSLLDSIRLDQLIKSSTRNENILLDILATDTAESVSDMEESMTLATS